ncbi:hypothetical protein BGLA2_1080006 [Burkholderia gladioli]|nr:hypothetical protein BGLA2_1080006 [Burkholderia gladioli]
MRYDLIRPYPTSFDRTSKQLNHPIEVIALVRANDPHEYTDP